MCDQINQQPYEYLEETASELGIKWRYSSFRGGWVDGNTIMSCGVIITVMLSDIITVNMNHVAVLWLQFYTSTIFTLSCRGQKWAEAYPCWLWTRGGLYCTGQSMLSTHRKPQLTSMFETRTFLLCSSRSNPPTTLQLMKIEDMFTCKIFHSCQKWTGQTQTERCACSAHDCWCNKTKLATAKYP